MEQPKIGFQEPPNDPRIFNRRQPDGTFRPISEFFEKGNTMKHTPMKVLESLPPGSSEFVDEPERCAQYIRDLIDSGYQAKKDLVRLKREKAALLKAAKRLIAYGGGTNIMGQPLCVVCARPADHDSDCPILGLVAAIALARPREG